MELVYIWTEEFRNLKNIGFNFSQSVRFYYDQLNKRLESTVTSDSKPGFFGDDIINVNAIIGKNGTGKSNLLDLICFLTKGSTSKFHGYILIYRSLDLTTPAPFHCKTNIEDLKLNSLYRSVAPSKSIHNLGLIFFSNVSDGRDQRFSKDVIDISMNSYKGFVSKKGNAYNQIKFLLSDYVKVAHIPQPSEVLITCRTDISLKKAVRSFVTGSKKIDYLLRRFRSPTNKRLTPPEQLRYAFRYALIVHSLNELFTSPEEHREREDPGYLWQLVEGVFDNHFADIQSLPFNIMHEHTEDFLEEMMLKFTFLGSINKDDMHFLLEFDKTIESLNPVAFDERGTQKKYFKISLDEKNRDVLRRFSKIFEFHEVIEVEWTGMSSGHKAFLNLFSQLHSTIRRVSQNDHALICVDEGDLYLHPEWQREFLDRLLNFIPTLFKKKIQFIFTTHSPFLISDLPKENLLLIGTDSNGNCMLRTDDIKLRQTFGANIYDLFKGPFVLEKSTISQFAFNKITKTIVDLKKEKPSDEEIAKARQVVISVGDEPIFFKLKEMLKDAENRL